MTGFLFKNTEMKPHISERWQQKHCKVSLVTFILIPVQHLTDGRLVCWEQNLLRVRRWLQCCWSTCCHLHPKDKQRKSHLIVARFLSLLWLLCYVIRRSCFIIADPIFTEANNRYGRAVMFDGKRTNKRVFVGSGRWTKIQAIWCLEWEPQYRRVGEGTSGMEGREQEVSSRDHRGGCGITGRQVDEL